jgi:hypothetical protein
LLIVQAWRRTPGHYSAHESPDDPLRTAGGIEFYYSEASLSWYARWPEHGFSFEERLAAGHAGAAAFPEATKVMGP